MSNLGPRQVAWVETSPSRVLMAGNIPLTVYQGELVLVLVGKDAEEIAKLIAGRAK